MSVLLAIRLCLLRLFGKLRKMRYVFLFGILTMNLVVYQLSFDVRKKEFELLGEELGTLIEIASKNRDPVRIEAIVINDGNSCNDWSPVMADGRPAKGNRGGYVLKYSQRIYDWGGLFTL
ncbi:hypothetical protein [Helicobacter suis]|uniref:hypothetical protein n=1 Tax=Helicobacter suis TaxID=104628 RepID=UPI0013D49352|nr:hypothetical protein [Helicobacter suis]